MPGTHSPRSEADAVFAHALGQALDSPQVREAMGRAPRAVDREQLRAWAHRERDTLCAAAAAEYAAYTRLRAGDGAGAYPGSGTASGCRTASESGTAPGSGPDADSGTDADSSGGLLPALAVLVPSLGAVAAALFLAIGFGMRLVGLHRQFADELVYAGWLAAGIAAAATMAGLAWVLVTAARNRSAAPAGETTIGDGVGPESEVARARAAWQLALLERGILPFLLSRIQEQQSRAGATTAAQPTRSRPEYASPGYGKPAYGSPAFESPAFESPERQG
ncbi:hypothetical protein [Streptomyces sp. NPDC052496]|uniref:hypothetical protein n=1 Tax=Streptomyces sp. NPDC052496 TaxID=3154951 RepID=UPI003418D634